MMDLTDYDPLFKFRSIRRDVRLTRVDYAAEMGRNHVRFLIEETRCASVEFYDHTIVILCIVRPHK